MDERELIELFLNGNDEVLTKGNDEEEIDISELHCFNKGNVSLRRKAKFKARERKRNIPVTAVDEAFYPKSAKQKKAYKKASSKAARRAREMVNSSSRSLNHKVYGDFDDKIKNSMKPTKGWNSTPGWACKKEQGK